MTTFDFTYVIDDTNEELAIAKALCWPFEIYSIEVEVDYTVSKYYPATRYQPEEGADVEDIIVTILAVNDTIMVTKAQAKIIEACLDNDTITEEVWDHWEKTADQCDRDYEPDYD